MITLDEDTWARDRRARGAPWPRLTTLSSTYARWVTTRKPATGKSGFNLNAGPDELLALANS